MRFVSTHTSATSQVLLHQEEGLTNGSLTVYLSSSELEGFPISVVELPEIPGSYISEEFELSEGTYTAVWDFDQDSITELWKVDKNFNDGPPSTYELQFEAETEDELTVDLYQLDDLDIVLIEEDLDVVATDIPSIYTCGPYSLVEEGRYLLVATTGDEYFIREINVSAPLKNTLAITLLDEDTEIGVAGVTVAVLNTAYSVVTKGITDTNGKIYFDIHGDTYYLYLVKDGFRFSTNLYRTTPTTVGNITVVVSLKMKEEVTISSTLPDEDMVTLEWYTYTLTGCPSRETFYVEALPSILASSAIVGSPLEVQPDQNGFVSIRLVKNITYKLHYLTGPSIIFQATEDGNPFDDYPNVSVSTYNPTSSLPSLPKRTI